VEVHNLVGKLSTAETLLTEVEVPTCPRNFLVINVCNQEKDFMLTLYYTVKVFTVEYNVSNELKIHSYPEIFSCELFASCSCGGLCFVFMWRSLLRVHVEVFASCSCGGLCFVFMWRSLLRIHVEVFASCSCGGLCFVFMWRQNSFLSP